MVLYLKWSLILVLAFFGNRVLSGQKRCDDDSWYLIRSAASNLVVDGSNSKVTIQHFDGYAPQLWKFKKGNSPGMFFIANNGTGRVLDVGENNKVVLMAENNESSEQQWFVHLNGRIVNAGKKLNLDIFLAKYVPGTQLGVVVDNGSGAQEFIVKEKITCVK